MAIESACIPLPSEIIMPFAGFLVQKVKWLNLALPLAGAIGVKVGENWESLGKYFHQSHYVIIAAGVAFVGWYLWRHFKKN